MDEEMTVGCLVVGVLILAAILVGGYFMGYNSWWADDETIRATGLECAVPFEGNVCKKPKSIWWIDFRVTRNKVTYMTKGGSIGGLRDCDIIDAKNWNCTGRRMRSGKLKTLTGLYLRYLSIGDGRWLRITGIPDGPVKINDDGNYEVLEGRE